MAIKILVFGQLTDLIGKSDWNQSGIENTDELKITLTKQFPEIDTIKYTIAVNKYVIQNNTELHTGDIVALLPPFSGG